MLWMRDHESGDHMNMYVLSISPALVPLLGAQAQGVKACMHACNIAQSTTAHATTALSGKHGLPCYKAPMQLHDVIERAQCSHCDCAASRTAPFM